MNFGDRIKRTVFGITLSHGLEEVKEKHRGSQTGRWYGSVIDQLIGVIGDIKVADVKPAHVDAWLKGVQDRNLSRWTVNSYTRAVKAFFGHMVKMGHIKESPAAHLKPPKPPRCNPKDISDDEVRALLRAAKRSQRDYAIICTLRDTGCRVGGLVSMQTTDLSIEETEHGKRGKILVIEKGDRPRHVFFGDETANAILAYLEIRAVYAPADLWLNRSDRPLTSSGVYHLLRNTAVRAGVKRFNPHSFRHRLCKKYVAAGTPHKVIQDLMGWQSAEMVQVYVIHTQDELQRYHEQYSP